MTNIQYSFWDYRTTADGPREEVWDTKIPVDARPFGHRRPIGSDATTGENVVPEQAHEMEEAGKGLWFIFFVNLIGTGLIVRSHILF